MGGSGYYGRESMYLQASTVATALDTDGATLDFFRIFAKIILRFESNQIWMLLYDLFTSIVPARGGAEVRKLP